MRLGKLMLLGDSNHLLYTPKTKEEIKAYREQYGWLSSDYNQGILQDPDLAIANPEDFLPFDFRHLSATIVGAGSWKATEFTEKVLREAVNRKQLDMKPSYVNHELEVGNIIGVVGKTVFQSATKGMDGQLIPAGINAPIWIDKVLHTDLCRKLTAFPVPHIQSVSVTVAYEWEPSHEFTSRDGSGEPDYWEFENRIGTMVDGKMVRRIVTRIVDFYESSLVWLGADPFAKALDAKGLPINVERSAVVGKDQYDADPLKHLYDKATGEGIYFVLDNSFTKQNTIDLGNSIVKNFSKNGNYINNNEDDVMKDTIEKLALMLGKKAEEVTAADLDIFQLVKKEDFTALNTKAGTVDTLTTEKAGLETTITENKVTLEKYGKIVAVDKLDELETSIGLGKVVAMADYGVLQLKGKRDEAIRLYKVAIPEADHSEAVIKAMGEADEATTDGYLKQYGKTAAEQFGGECKKCGSKEISYQSSEPEGTEGGKKETGSDHIANDFRD